MAYFAKIDENNIVVDVRSVHNNETHDETGIENEQKGIDFLNEWEGFESRWIQTSYNGRIRKNFAGLGFTYDEARDAFIPPKPYDSWIIDEETCRWEAPVSMPDPVNGHIWVWNETIVNWESIKAQEIN
jgi:hypothetical protein